MHPFIQPLDQQFRLQANPVKAGWMKAYMLHQFAFYGLQTPERRKLSKEHFRQYPVNNLKELETIVKECFSLPQREFQYFGIELMGYHKKLWKPSSIKCMEYCLIHKSWWDSVDHIAAECLGLTSNYFHNR